MANGRLAPLTKSGEKLSALTSFLNETQEPNYIFFSSCINCLGNLCTAKNSRTTTLDRSKADFSVPDTARVSRVFIADKLSGKTYDLVRKGKRQWLLNGNIQVAWPMADLMLGTLHDLAIKRPVGEKELKPATQELATSHLKVEVYQEGNLTKTFFMGPEIDEQKANYAILEGQDQPWVVYVPALVGFPGARFKVDAVRWRDKALFESIPQTLQRIEVKSFDQPGYDVMLTFKGRHFNLEGANGIDTGRVGSFVNAFRAIYVEEFLTDKKLIDSIKSLKPTWQVKVEDIDNTKSTRYSFFHLQPL